MEHLQDSRLYGDYYSVIYVITCKDAGRIYIGETDYQVKRWATHRRELSKTEHHNPDLVKDWQSLGAEKFVFEVLERFVPWEKLRERERQWIAHLEGHYLLYNERHNRRPQSPKPVVSAADLPRLPEDYPAPVPVPDANILQRTVMAPYDRTPWETAEWFADQAYAWWALAADKAQRSIWPHAMVGLNAFVDHVLRTELKGSELWTVTCWIAAWRHTAYRDDPATERDPLEGHGTLGRWQLASVAMHHHCKTRGWRLASTGR